MMRVKQIVLCFIAASLVSACGDRSAEATPTAPAAATVAPNLVAPTSVATSAPPTSASSEAEAPPVAAGDDDALIDEILAGMSVEEKLGQLFMVFFEGTHFSPELERTIRELHIGGILIFHGNVGPLEELAGVIAAAQSTAAQSGAQIPLFVGVDHEGGLITRFGDRVTEFPGPMALAATGYVENARAVAEAMSEELQALGINMNLAPVLDVNNNPDNPVIGPRAFGSTPEIVSRFGMAMLGGFQNHGLVATAKHFPGHGDTAIDSHTSLPVIDKEVAQLQAVELAPFGAAIDAGVDVIMTAHVAVPSLSGDPELPATFSRPILNDLLREQMGFEGLIAADSLGMDALDVRYGITQTAALAVDAGVDLLMFGADPGHSPIEQMWAFEYLLARIESGELSVARLDESVRRILQVKARYGLLVSDAELAAAPLPEQLQGSIRTPEHLALADRISEQAVTLVKNDAGVLPLAAGQSVALIYPDFETDLPELFSALASTVITIPTTIDPDAAQRDRISALAAQADVIVLATVYANFYPGQVALVEALQNGLQNQPLVVMAITSPYDLLAFPSLPTYLTTYNDNRSLLAAAVKMIYGQITPSGSLPVELPPHFPAGHGVKGW